MQTHRYPAAYGPAVALLAVASAAAVLLATATHGPWLAGDAVHYIYAAKSLLAGDGYLQYGAGPLVRWPPLFPTLLGLLGLLKIEPIEGARAINALALGASVALAGQLFRRCIADWRLSMLAVISISFSLPLLEVSVAAVSEPVFILLILAFVLLVARYLERPTLRSLLLAAACAGLASLQQYIGVAAILTGIVLIGSRSPGGKRQLLRDGALFTLLSGAPLAGWLYRNHLRADTVMGEGTFEPLAVGDALLLVAKPVIGWFLPIRTPHPEWAAIVSLAMACLLIVCCARRAIWAYVSAPGRRATLRVLAVLVPTYVLLLVLAVQRYRLGGTTIDPERLVAPLYIFGVLGAFLGADLSLEKIRESRLRRRSLFSIGVLLLCSGFTIRTVLESPQQIHDWNVNGAGGYNQPHWQTSPTMLGLQDLPMEATIYTNAKYAVWVHTAREARSLQAWKSSEDPTSRQYFVWFDGDLNNAEWVEFYAGSDLCGLGLFDDGAIFQMPTDASSSSSTAAPCVAAITEHGAGHEYNRTVGLRKLRRVIRLAGGVEKVAVCRCAPQKEIRLEQGNGLGTMASIYDRGGPEPRPGAILIHGNTWMGRRLSTYRVLASKLADRGWIVLAFDQLGFGESDDPMSLGTAGAREAWDRKQMAEAALEYLLNNTLVDRTRLSVIGHSAGAITALKLGLASDEIGDIVLIGPPRAAIEQVDETEDQGYHSRRFLETYRFVYGKPVPDWFTVEMMAKATPWSLEAYMDAFARPGHKPLMFVDGELELEEDKESLEKVYETLVHPKRFLRLRNGDHYSNTAQSLGLIFYDQAVTAQLVGEIDRWREQAERE